MAKPMMLKPQFEILRGPKATAVNDQFRVAAKGKRIPLADTQLPRLIKERFPQVKTVSDAEGPIRVSVTRKDQAGSNPLQPDSCAMARACKRELDVDGAIIGVGTSYIVQGTNVVRFCTPVSLAREITTFDRHGEFAAGEYSLSRMNPSRKIGYTRTRTPKPPNGTSRTRRFVHATTGVRRFGGPGAKKATADVGQA